MIKQKELMIFIFAEVFFKECEKGIDTLNDFVAGESLRENFGKFMSPAELQECLERLTVKVFG